MKPSALVSRLCGVGSSAKTCVVDQLIESWLAAANRVGQMIDLGKRAQIGIEIVYWVEKEQISLKNSSREAKRTRINDRKLELASNEAEFQRPARNARMEFFTLTNKFLYEIVVMRKFNFVVQNIFAAESPS